MMPKSSAFDAINQQLDALSLDELQLVRAKVDLLIAEKLSQAKQDNWKTIQKSALLRTQYTDILRTIADEERKSIEILRTIADEERKSIEILKTLADESFASAYRCIDLINLRQSYSPELPNALRDYTFVVKRQKNLREEDRLLSSSEIEQLLVEQKSSLEEDDSLERIIELVSEWMSDDSGYDETVLPEIKAGLDQNRFG